MPATLPGWTTGKAPRRRRDVNPRTNPLAAGPPSPVPQPRGRTVFTEPLAQAPFHRQQRQAARHVARAVLDAKGEAPHRPLRDAEVRRVLNSPSGRAMIESARRVTAPPYRPHRSFLDKAIDFATGSSGGANMRVALGGPTNYNPGGIESGRVASTAIRATAQTGRAFVSDPLGVGSKTTKGLGELAVGGIAAIPELTARTISGSLHGDPLEGLRQLLHQAGKDLSRRYGPLYRGEPGAGKKFRQRIKKEGAASELVDAATLAVPEGALFGRGLGAVARAGRLGPRAARFASEARPALRISGEASRPQELSRNLIRASGQRAEDALRRRAARSRLAEAEKGRPVRGLQPRPGEVVAATRVTQRRLQRVEQSKLTSRGYEAFRNEMTTEVDKGARRSMSKLNRNQRRAIYPVLQGYVDASSPARAIETLKARNEQIQAARAVENAARKEKGLGPRAIGAGLHEDEARLNSHLIAHANEVFGDGKLKAFQESEAARSIRVAREAENAHPAFKSSTAEVRRLRGQAMALGIEHGHDRLTVAIDARYAAEKKRVGDLPEAQQAAARKDLERQYEQALEKAHEMKPRLDTEYVSAVRAEARRHGLAEPAYIAHHPRGDYPFSDFAPGGARAVAGVKRSQMRLHALGIADTRPQRYIQSLARTIKVAHNWPTVARQAETHSFHPSEFGSKADVENVLGRPNVNLDHLSIEDWRRLLHAKGLDPREYAFWNPGRLRKARDTLQEEGHPLEHLDSGLDPEGSPGLHEGWQQSAADEVKLREAGPDSVYMRTRGWRLIPREVYSEITAGTHPSGLGGRLVSKAQGFQSRVLLGTNPSWLQMQVAANAVLTGFGAAVKGNLHPVEAQRWYASLPPDAKKAADEALSLGVLQEHGAYSHLGASTDAKIVGWVRGLGELPPFQKAKRANPINLLFKGDDAQNKFFRKTLLYSSVKRQALQDIGRGVGDAYDSEKKIAGLFSIRDPKARMTEILRNQPEFERHAEFVNRILGDYSRYTARERRTLKRYTLFYGFMRYAIKTLFYTLPVKHPLAMAVSAKLAQLHNDEVKDLLGGDQAPWAFSRIFFEGKNGKLRSIDLGRVNPVTSPVVGLVTEGPKALAGLFSPAGQEVLDQIYGKQLYTGMGYRVHGSAEENTNPDLIARGRIALNHMLSTNFLAREAGKATQGSATQGDDALPFSARPIHYKTAQAQAREIERRATRGPVAEQLKRDLFPLAFTKPDTTRESIAAQERRAGKPITVPGQRVGKPAPPSLNWGAVDWSHVDWSKSRIPSGNDIDWSKVDWSKVGR